MVDPRTDPSATLRHWRVEVNFEAWDEEDALRMLHRIIGPALEEQRLLFATSPPVETTEYARDV